MAYFPRIRGTSIPLGLRKLAGPCAPRSLYRHGSCAEAPPAPVAARTAPPAPVADGTAPPATMGTGKGMCFNSFLAMIQCSASLVHHLRSPFLQPLCIFNW
ncbi:hypothetical protein E2C01_089392 [Portunus trituberculatus]|uniref:Uncharacterized protein n=1 Tax=Portunus trituberculatus TaxID=210409 RepID=A0A5B7JBU7_PORTR|nr:hypothetical protein [Portunus trituberculatus]